MSSVADENKRLVLINATSSFATQLLSVAVLVWLHQHLLRRVGADEYQIYPVVVSVVVFVQILTGIVTGGIARYVTMAHANGDDARIREVVSSVVPLTRRAAALLLSAGGLASWYVDSLLRIPVEHRSDAQIMLGLLVALQALSLLATPYMVGLHVRQRFVTLNLIRLGDQLLRCGLMLALFIGFGTRVLWVVVSMTVSSALATTLTAILSRRCLPALRYERGCQRHSTARELRAFGLWTMLGGVAWRIRTNANAIILNRFATPTDVTVFNIASIPDRQMSGLVGAASVVLQPVLTTMHAREDRAGLGNAYLRGNRLYLWVVLAVAVPLIFFAEEIVRLYAGNAYVSAAVVMVLLYGTYPITYANAMLFRVANATGKVRLVYGVSVVTAVANVSLSIGLVHGLGMGALGAALAGFLVSTAAALFVHWPIGLRMLSIPFRRFLRETLLPGWLPAVVCAFSVLILGELVPATSWQTLGFDVAMGWSVYAAVGLACLRRQERRDLARVWRWATTAQAVR